ncbi:hypothetical protein [Porphyromonas sp. COT-290 OH860]|nr:hypothetical protein [Porphyromonas sp. COT-290 OH860]
MSKFISGTAPFKMFRMRKLQGAKTEADRSILKYVTEADDKVCAE